MFSYSAINTKWSTTARQGRRDDANAMTRRTHKDGHAMATRTWTPTTGQTKPTTRIEGREHKKKKTELTKSHGHAYYLLTWWQL